ncbi:conserved hypothetical protein [Bifidobacterium catenulatum DSM 16992 = JCM 1194 = LMG 11043]|uniref:Uncharacterized protein n=2 Tax=Bifidobacterium catenulatum DSM 16992 = JCM 1194 = LMG 11043 TaxID=566552 RepID=A0ABM7ET53_9BIFI|nr:hypothetical protein BIFCAT_01981 [Bifidobacterium catenulatum DSM 16992 = JCM 1194 = LMG 11043]BAR01101.1 conserved hypothetical protein [Bifidobacterium catenulatum DSM 16992 = JCM 1194 = LMG 11043]
MRNVCTKKRAEDLQGFRILFRMLGVQGLDKSNFSYNRPACLEWSAGNTLKKIG